MIQASKNRLGFIKDILVLNLRLIKFGTEAAF